MAQVRRPARLALLALAPVRALARPRRLRVAPRPRRRRGGAGHQRHRRPGRHRSPVRDRPGLRPPAPDAGAAARGAAGRRPTESGGVRRRGDPGDAARTPPPAPPRPAAAAGFKNQTGITDSKITLANISDISGPVPGIFESAQEATRAYAAYFNSSNDLCGRKLDVVLLDSRADSGADQQAYTKACDEAFAAVGSMSAFDAGGAATAEQCGLPDIRSTAVNPERNDCSTCFAAQAIDPGDIPSAVHKYFLKTEQAATQKAAMLYINARCRAGQRAGVRRGRREERLERDLRRGHRRLGVQLRAVRPGDEGSGRRSWSSTSGPTRTRSSSSRPCSSRASSRRSTSRTPRSTTPVRRAGRRGGRRQLRLHEQPDVRAHQHPGDGALPELAAAGEARRDADLLRPLRLVRDPAVRRAGGRARRQARPQDPGRGDEQGRQLDGNGLHVPMHVGAKETAECTMIIQLNGGKWSQKSPGQVHLRPHHGDGAEPMTSLLSFTILGLFTGAAYAIAASGLVLTYTTTRVFNIAHGAFGMVMAFVFWDFSQRQGLPMWLSLVLVLGVVAPGTGWLVQRYVTRGLGEGPVSVSLVVTVGLFVGLIGLAQQIWPPAPRTIPFLMPESGLEVGGAFVPAHQLITIALSAVVAVGLYAPAQPDPHRHRDARVGRQPRPAPPVRRQAVAGGRPVVGDRHRARRPRRHPAHAGDRARLLQPHPAGHQRVRRRDARPAQEPAADLRSARWASASSSRTPWRTCRPTATWPGSGRSCRRCSCSR